MKRYFGFAGSFYYPNGGMRDFIGFYDTIEDATKGIKDYLNENWVSSDYWAHVWDSETKQTIILNID